MNLDHQIWCNPWDKGLASNASFVDLFIQSLKKCSTVYYLLNQILVSSVPMEEQDFHALLEQLGNYSYHSGLPIED